MKNTNVMACDVLIVGTGVAGLYCALNLPSSLNIVIISKARAEECDSYLAQGGICVLKDESDYDAYFEDTMRAGHYENNLRNGQGTYTWARGDVFKGNWVNGEREGQGRYEFANGAVYEGEFVLSKFEGEGKYASQNGSVYVGTFHIDRRHGYGVYTTPGGTELAGNWENNKYMGTSYSPKGIMTSVRGAIYHQGQLTPFGIGLIVVLVLSLGWFAFRSFRTGKETK